MDVLIVGSGPAGMTAAIELQANGLAVTVIDDQPLPGGRIYAAIETRKVHDADDRRGADLVARFRSNRGDYQPGTEVWQIEKGPRVFLSKDGRATMTEPRFVLLATGAQERPMPFTGWEMPGVMTVGGAQILLKTAKQIPDEPVWLAGSGPLLLLYAHQLLAVGGTIAGILDTTRPASISSVAKLLSGAVGFGWRDLLRGLSWMAEMRKRKIKIIRGVECIEAEGTERLRAVRFKTRDGRKGHVTASLLLTHDGVVPNVHATMSAGCDHRWNVAQQCFEPILDEFGESSIPSIFVAGDGSTIAGARAAALSGQLAAIGIARAAGNLSASRAESRAVPIRRDLAAARGFRRLIDTMYPPVGLPIADDVIACRCEEVTAGRLREALRGRPELGPDGAKIATRAGMGPCQGRQCGLTLTRIASEVSGRKCADLGFLRIRPPLKPLTLGELASLETPC